MNHVLEHTTLTHPRFAPAAARSGEHRSWWRRLVLRWQTLRDVRRTRRALEQLDDRMLKDIGLGAHDVWLRSRAGNFSDREYFDL